MLHSERLEVLRSVKGGQGPRGSILWALLGLLFLTAFLPLVLTSRYLVNQARADLEFDQRSLQMAKVRHLSEWIAQFRSSSRSILKTLATGLAIDAPADYRKRVDSLAASQTLEAFPGEVRFFARNLTTGETAARAAGQAVYVGDLFRIMPVLAYARQVSEGILSGDDLVTVAATDLRQGGELKAADVGRELRLPHIGFNRAVGGFRDHHVSPDGRLLSDAEWDANVDDWLPTDAVRQEVRCGPLKH